MTTGLLAGIVAAAAGGGVLGWWIHRLGENARRAASEAYYAEMINVADRARDRARVEAEQLARRLNQLRGGAEGTDPSGQVERARAAADKIGQLEAELGRLAAKLRDRDTSLARLRAELDAKKAHLAQSNGRGEVSRLKAELAKAQGGLREREAELRRVEAELRAGRAEVETARNELQASQSELARVRNGNGHGRANGNGEGPAWLLSAAEGEPDDLKAIRGLGPVLERGLNELGIFHYRQLAQITQEDAEWLSLRLRVFPGRILRDDWMSQARKMHFRKYKQRL